MEIIIIEEKDNYYSIETKCYYYHDNITSSRRKADPILP